MSYQNYPGLAESPPPSAQNSFSAKSEPIDLEFDRGGGNGWKRQPPPSGPSSSDSWASKSGAYSGNDRSLELGRRDSPAAFYRQPSANSTEKLQQEHYMHDNAPASSTAYFSEEFRGHCPKDSSVVCTLPAAFRSPFHPRTKSRFDEILEDGQGQSAAAADFRGDRRVYGGDIGGQGIQMDDEMAAIFLAQPTPTAQNYQQPSDGPKSDAQLNLEFFRPPTPSSTSLPKKRTFAEMSSFDHSFNASPSTAAKVTRVVFTSYPAASPAVLKSYIEDRRGGAQFIHLQQNDKQSPLEIEARNSLLDLRQELAFIDSLDPSVNNCLTNSRRLLVGESLKLEEWHNPDWVEVDHNRPIKLSKQILVPTFRYPTFNFVGRIVGFKGTTLARICRKYKCFIAILGANSTKDRQQEVELLQSGDYRYAHYASPMHIRIDVIAPTHLAHIRMAGVINLFHKLLIPNRNFDIDAELADVDLSDKKEKAKSKSEKMQRWAEEERRWEAEFEEANGNGRTDGRQNYWPRRAMASTANGTEKRQNENGTTTANATSYSTPSPPVNMSSASYSASRGGSSVRARGGGFVPRGMRPRGDDGMNTY